jgi:flagellar biogenesis protein FliO
MGNEALGGLILTAGLAIIVLIVALVWLFMPFIIISKMNFQTEMLKRIEKHSRAIADVVQSVKVKVD